MNGIHAHAVKRKANTDIFYRATMIRILELTGLGVTQRAMAELFNTEKVPRMMGGIWTQTHIYWLANRAKELAKAGKLYPSAVSPPGPSIAANRLEVPTDEQLLLKIRDEEQRELRAIDAMLARQGREEYFDDTPCPPANELTYHEWRIANNL